MSDFKSKLPDLKELGSMTSKLFNGIKSSVNEIIHDYKEKREEEEALRSKESTVAQETTVTQKQTTVKVDEASVTPVDPVDPPPITVTEEKPKEDKDKHL
jgi:hypothetical protein